ncbi:hypothetical protein [Alienimonas chondri]|uniref:Uncharacterized protein n=1 Tax=Alienimonas chondri TaxID=2681879 RepID=A0ABX1VF66_9PLAN|nr:hypothetical protein [Alienimonas chondri]NNJ26727.1 hypothetical protein [Alienimonas chondri]
MKIYRIIFSSLLVIGGIAAFYFSIRSLDTQSSWSSEANEAQAAAEQAAEGLPALRANELQLTNELRAANAGFGQVLTARQPQFDAQGNVALDIGTADGLAAGEAGAAAPVVHLFAPTGEGDASVYIGPFSVVQAAERSSQLAPTFVVQPGEPQTWPVAAPWRVRYDVPASRASQFETLDASLVTRREVLGNRRNTLELRRQSVADAQDTLAARERALLGDPDAPEISDAPEIKAGIIAATTAEEQDRAERLVELDQLRRAVKNASDRLRAALAENVDLAGRLPTAAPPRTAQGE